MVCVHDFPRGEVSVKVGVMEFGLMPALANVTMCRRITWREHSLLYRSLAVCNLSLL